MILLALRGKWAGATRDVRRGTIFARLLRNDDDDEAGNNPTMLEKTKIIHFLAGAVGAALALPLGITAAALAPVLLGFLKEMYLHLTGRHADPGNLAWVIAGAATFVLCFKRVPIGL